MRTSLDILDENRTLDVLLACRPVLNRGQEVSAIQLLLDEDGTSRGASVSDLEHTSPVILGTYASMFQNGRVEVMPSFLCVSEEMLLAPQLTALPKKQYILEVPCDLLLTSDVVERLRSLARRGYRLALADYDPDDSELDILLEVVHIAKVNTRHLDHDDVARAVRRLRRFGVEMLADDVDDRVSFRQCVELGFHYFQGDFLHEPEPVRGKKIAGNKLLLLQLLSELLSDDASPARLEEIATKDAQLTWRILRTVNSAATGLHREVNSVSHAIALLGLNEIRRWANLFLVEDVPGKPEVLTRDMLVRGRMCEAMAQLCDRDNPVDHFIVGLLSQLDALLDISMPELMEQVPLSHEIKAALLKRAGGLGEILTEVEAYQAGRFDSLHLLHDRRYYEVAYRHSVAWTRQAQQAMSPQ